MITGPLRPLCAARPIKLWVPDRGMACFADPRTDRQMRIQFITTGGTIDKIYFDAMSQFEVGESQVEHILREGLVQFDYDIVSLFRKDSLEISPDDRRQVREYVERHAGDRYVITHGTDTMVETAAALAGLSGKVIVLTGALSPARFRTTDAVFNIGMAVAAVQIAAPGVYIAMSGQIFDAAGVRKNRAANRFEPLR
jgi:L-asparaginase